MFRWLWRCLGRDWASSPLILDRLDGLEYYFSRFDPLNRAFNFIKWSDMSDSDEDKSS